MIGCALTVMLGVTAVLSGCACSANSGEQIDASKVGEWTMTWSNLETDAEQSQELSVADDYTLVTFTYAESVGPVGLAINKDGETVYDIGQIDPGEFSLVLNDKGTYQIKVVGMAADPATGTLSLTAKSIKEPVTSEDAAQVIGDDSSESSSNE